jgi:ubiquinol-cytochrome c reductase iron-sulfur subunit
MPHPIPQPDQVPARRRFLARLTAATAALGAAASAWPLLASLAPAADTLAQDETVFDLAGLSPGGSLLVTWRQRPVMAIHRSPAELEALRKLGPAPFETDTQALPWPIRTSHRGLRADLAVFTAMCTHDSASLPPPERQGERAGRFRCPWCGSHYDLAGRLRGYGPARLALHVPPYLTLRENSLLVGRTAPANA